MTHKHKHRARITGIKEAAAELGVTRQHLRLVIHGKRDSKPIEQWLRANLGIAVKVRRYRGRTAA